MSSFHSFHGAGIVPFDLMFDVAVAPYTYMDWSKEETERVRAVVSKLPPASYDFSLDSVSAFVEDPDGVRYTYETRNSGGFVRANQRHVSMAAFDDEEMKEAIRRADREAHVRVAAAMEAHAQRMEPGREATR